MPINRIEFRKESTQEWVTAESRDPADEDGLRLYGAGKDPSGYPARPDFFWDGNDIVARSVILSDVTYSEENGLNFTLTRARQ